MAIIPHHTDSETEAQRWLNNLLRVTQPSRVGAGTGYRGLSPSPVLLKVGGRFQWMALGATTVNKLRSQVPCELLCAPGSVLLLFCKLLHQDNGLPRWHSGKELACQCRRHRSNPWVGKIPWRREWLPIAVFLPGESQGRGSLVGCCLWGRTELDTTEAT